MPSTAHADTAIVAAATAAPINPQTLRDLVTNLTTPEPEPAPALDQALIARVRDALRLPHWRPDTEAGETETRLVMWSQLELNAIYEQHGGTITTRQAARTDSTGDTWTATEITLTTAVRGVGEVTLTTDWHEPLGGHDLPIARAMAAPAPVVLETVPAQPGRGIGYDRLAVAPGAPLPGGRVAVAVEDPLGSAWRVTDAHGAVHYLHKHGRLVRYVSGVVSFVEPEWAGWASD